MAIVIIFLTQYVRYYSCAKIPRELMERFIKFTSLQFSSSGRRYLSACARSGTGNYEILTRECVLHLVSAAWSRLDTWNIRIYIASWTCSAPRHTVQHYDNINASRHAQSEKGPECSNNHKGSELYIIASRHPLTTRAPKSSQQHRNGGA
jgi:hypothetical protein